MTEAMPIIYIKDHDGLGPLEAQDILDPEHPLADGYYCELDKDGKFVRSFIVFSEPAVLSIGRRRHVRLIPKHPHTPMIVKGMLFAQIPDEIMESIERASALTSSVIASPSTENNECPNDK